MTYAPQSQPERLHRRAVVLCAGRTRRCIRDRDDAPRRECGTITKWQRVVGTKPRPIPRTRLRRRDRQGPRAPVSTADVLHRSRRSPRSIFVGRKSLRRCTPQNGKATPHPGAQQRWRRPLHGGVDQEWRREGPSCRSAGTSFVPSPQGVQDAAYRRGRLSRRPSRADRRLMRVRSDAERVYAKGQVQLAHRTASANGRRSKPNGTTSSAG